MCGGHAPHPAPLIICKQPRANEGIGRRMLPTAQKAIERRPSVQGAWAALPGRAGEHLPQVPGGGGVGCPSLGPGCCWSPSRKGSLWITLERLEQLEVPALILPRSQPALPPPRPSARHCGQAHTWAHFILTTESRDQYPRYSSFTVGKSPAR